jgi:uncharacterized surface protein with fasciclin (FAS1) repeats
VSAGAALGAGELIAGVDDGLTSPVEAVAGEAINRVPRSVERYAIETFGSTSELETFTGAVLPVESDGNTITVGGRQARVVVPDIQTANATVHLADQVMVPPAG